jgi:hypothetical protein
MDPMVFWLLKWVWVILEVFKMWQSLWINNKNIPAPVATHVALMHQGANSFLTAEAQLHAFFTGFPPVVSAPGPAATGGTAAGSPGLQ